MKQKDATLILVIAVVSAIISFVLSGILFGSSQKQQTAQVVPVISASFQTPSAQYFNSQSIDPTQLIQIGTSNNNAPFNGSSQ